MVTPNFRLKKVLKFLPSKRDNFLEVGCAGGHNAPLFKSHFKRYYGLEPFKPAVIQARKDYPKGKFSVGVIEDTDYKDSFFDAIALIEVFEHVDNEIKSLNEIYRISKEKSRIIITTPYKGIFSNFDPENYKYLFGRKSKNKRRGYDHIHRHYNLKVLKNLLDKSDFRNHYKIEKSTSTGGILSAISVHLQVLSKKLFNPKLSYNVNSYLKRFCSLDDKVPQSAMSWNFTAILTKI